MRRLPGGSLTAAAVLLGVLLLGAAFPDSFLFHRLFTVRRWPFPFRRDIVVLHVILAAVLLGWSVFTARFLKLRKDTAEAARECEAAWGRLSPLARDRAGVLTRLEAPLRRLAPGGSILLSARSGTRSGRERRDRSAAGTRREPADESQCTAAGSGGAPERTGRKPAAAGPPDRAAAAGGTHRPAARALQYCGDPVQPPPRRAAVPLDGRGDRKGRGVAASAQRTYGRQTLPPCPGASRVRVSTASLAESMPTNVTSVPLR